MLKEFKRKRSRLQLATVAGLPLVVVGGWFYPALGFMLLGCMLGAIGIALYKGRAWCDWMCPRGSFFDLFISRFSSRRPIPTFFRSPVVRISLISVLFAVLGAQLYFAWGDMDAMGLAFVKVLSATTLIGVVLGISYQERVWCHVCPMGTFGNYLASGKEPLTIDPACASCKLCARVCPMQLKPYEYRQDGRVAENDCIKCGSCVAACPKKVLAFRKELKRAA